MTRWVAGSRGLSHSEDLPAALSWSPSLTRQSVQHVSEAILLRPAAPEQVVVGPDQQQVGQPLLFGAEEQRRPSAPSSSGAVLPRRTRASFPCLRYLSTSLAPWGVEVRRVPREQNPTMTVGVCQPLVDPEDRVPGGIEHMCVGDTGALGGEAHETLHDLLRSRALVAQPGAWAIRHQITPSSTGSRMGEAPRPRPGAAGSRSHRAPGTSHVRIGPRACRKFARERWEAEGQRPDRRRPSPTPGGEFPSGESPTRTPRWGPECLGRCVPRKVRFRPGRVAR